MLTVSETQLRARYAEILDRVAEDHDEVVVTRSGHESVVLVSLKEYESLKETVHLTRSPANARRLLDAMGRLENGAAARHDIVESTGTRRPRSAPSHYRRG